MDGALIIDKPAGLTSHDVVARVRKISGERRAGHTGTLDPFATGVLVVLLGKATRLAQFLSGAEKEYEALVRFGYATDTGDRTGTCVTSPLTRNPEEICASEIEAALEQLRGHIQQLPPMYSAKKIGGRKLYDLARRGEEVERAAVTVDVRVLEALPENRAIWADARASLSDLEVTRDFALRVVCSAGTYVRVLAEDLGKKLGVTAHLADLRRTRAGSFEIGNATTLDELKELAETNSVESRLITLIDAVSQLPFIEVTSEQVMQICHGIDLEVARVSRGVGRGNNLAGEAPTRPEDWPDKQPVRLAAGNELVAVGIYDQSRQLIHPKVVVKG
jgi:tRNA pseudouridine55 synthase